nr:MAG TPA: hypothetical protein [Caudoviricetes sp.]
MGFSSAYRVLFPRDLCLWFSLKYSGKRLDKQRNLWLYVHTQTTKS